jgi:DNA-binding transcriptional regulator YiaG
MKSPFTGKEMIIYKEWRTMSFRKEEFRVYFHVYKCEDTGEQFEDEAFAELNFNQLVNQYRVKYNIPFPEEIKAIRERYGLSASKMAEVLGFGANSYRNYESGEVPSQSNARLIQLISDAREFKKLVELSNVFEGKALEKELHKIDVIIQEQKQDKFITQLENYFLGTKIPNSNTGYKVPNIEKFTEMVVFFTEKLQPWKTKLNKLLFYTDFSMYRKLGYSISGSQYRAIPMGPVPNNFQSIFEYLANNDDVDICYTTFPDGNTGEQFKPNAKRQFNPEVFTLDELNVLEEIIERFKDTSTQRIIEISHKEKAWLENKDERKIIDYCYGFDLNC